MKADERIFPNKVLSGDGFEVYDDTIQQLKYGGFTPIESEEEGCKASHVTGEITCWESVRIIPTERKS